MKKITLSLFILLSIQFGYSQCLEVVEDFGNNMIIPMYNIEGTVELTLNTDNTVTLELGSDFMTAPGPDIRAFLVNSGGLSDAQLTNTLIADLENVEFGLVGSDTINQNGAKSFTISIPGSSNIQDFDKVFFYCLQFDQFWDFGTYESFTPDTCNVLGIDDISLNETVLWPNPAQGEVQLSIASKDRLSVEVYDIAGQIVKTIPNVVNAQKLDINNLVAGVYMVKLTTNEGNFKMERLIVN